MQYRILGRTGIRVSAIALGAGPVSGLMTGNDTEAQQAVIGRAIEQGINWFDTAAGYGQGASESNLGKVFHALRPSSSIHIATKVRIPPESAHDFAAVVRKSVSASLARLQVEKVTLLQLHNGITARREDEPASITPEDILMAGGVADALDRMRAEGLVDFLGLTATGQPEALRRVIRSNRFDTIQVPYNLLNPSAGEIMPSGFAEMNYGNVIADCDELKMGVFAIRIFAAGALLDQPPSAHTKITPYFPLSLYERDRLRTAELQKQDQEKKQKPSNMSFKEFAVRFVLSDSRIQSAIVGFGTPEQVDEVSGFGSVV